MPRTILVIDGDATALKRVFSEIREEGRTAAAAVAGEWKKAGDETSKAFRKMRRDAGKALAEIKALEMELSHGARAESERRQQVAASEGSYRVSARRRAADGEKRAEEDVTRTHQRESRRRISDAEREARARQRAAARTGERIGGAVVSAGTQFAGAVHGEVQSARQRRAGSERNLGLAIYQAGGGRRDVLNARSRVNEFASQQNMDPAEIAAALNAAQTEFSTLGDRSTGRGERSQRLEGFLQTAQLARDTGNNVGEFGRLQGLFAQQGFDPTTQRQMLLYAAGAAQRGAIETGTLTRQAMPAITGRMNQAMTAARSRGATGADVQAAGRDAFAQAMAEIEVARGTQGTSAREAGNVLRNVNTSLQSDVVQQKMLTNIRTRFGRNSQVEQSLFEADPTRRGRMRLQGRYTDALAMTERFGQVAGNDPTLFQNVFAGGGHGNPQALLANQRRILGNLLGADAEGRTGVGRTRDLLGPGTALTEQDVTRGRETFSQDAQSTLTAEQTAHDNALTDNTSKIVELSNRFSAWSSQNPLASTAVQTGGGLVGGAVASRLGGLAGRTVAGPLGRVAAMLGLGGGATGATAATTGATAGRGLLATAGGGLAALAMTALAVGGSVLTYTRGLEGSNRTARNGRGGSETQGGEDFELVRRLQAQGQLGGQQAPITTEGIQQAVTAGVQAGIQGSGGVPVRMNPVEQAHAQAQNTGQRRPPTP